MYRRLASPSCPSLRMGDADYQVGGPPEVADGVAGEAERAQAGVDGVALARAGVACSAEELGRPVDGVGHAVEDASEAGDGAPLTSVEDVVDRRLAGLGHGRQRDRRIEHAEGGDHDLA